MFERMLTIPALIFKDATFREVLWTVPALIAAVLRGFLLEWVFDDRQFWQREHKTHPNRDLAPELIWSTSQLYHKVALLSVLILMASFGLVAMFTPPATTPPPPPTRVSNVLTFVFISIPIILSLDATQTIINRKRTQRADHLRAVMHRRRAGDGVEGTGQ